MQIGFRPGIAHCYQLDRLRLAGSKGLDADTRQRSLPLRSSAVRECSKKRAAQSFCGRESRDKLVWRRVKKAQLVRESRRRSQLKSQIIPVECARLREEWERTVWVSNPEGAIVFVEIDGNRIRRRHI